MTYRDAIARAARIYAAAIRELAEAPKSGDEREGNAA